MAQKTPHQKRNKQSVSNQMSGEIYDDAKITQAKHVNCCFSQAIQCALKFETDYTGSFAVTSFRGGGLIPLLI